MDLKLPLTQSSATSGATSPPPSRFNLPLFPGYSLSRGYDSASAISAYHFCNSSSDSVIIGPILSETVPLNEAAVLYSAVLRGHIAIVESQKDWFTMS